MCKNKMQPIISRKTVRLRVGADDFNVGVSDAIELVGQYGRRKHGDVLPRAYYSWV